MNITGLIGKNGDQDVFKLTTAGGNLSLILSVATSSAQPRSAISTASWSCDANGQVVAIANDTRVGILIQPCRPMWRASGTYYLVVRSSGGYGNVAMHAYRATSFQGVVTAPEISVLFGNADLTSGGSANFGSTLLNGVSAQNVHRAKCR